jgi:hypothetical protein
MIIKEISLIISRGSIKFCSVLNSLLNSLRVGFGFMVFNATFNKIFEKKSHYVDCLIKELGIDTIHLATLHIPRRHLRKRKSWTIIGLFYVPLEFQPKMKNWIYHHSTGFLNYTSVLSNSTILLGLPNAPQNLFCGILYFKLNGIDAINEITKPRSI